MNPINVDPKRELALLRDGLLRWLVEDAFPLWATRGIDEISGGFVEAIGQDGFDLNKARRARVQTRQVYAFAKARGFGWHGDAANIVRRGTKYFATVFQRRDGLYRTLVAVDGSPLDDSALLYDHAFALLGLAAATTELGERLNFETQALQLQRLIRSRFAAKGAGFRSSERVDDVRESNPHMHLLEACLAWRSIGGDSTWSELAEELIDLALTSFVRDDSGAIGETYTASWQPASGLPGRLIEPGHQFEWASLLLRSGKCSSGAGRETALRLLSIGEQFGVHDNLAMNSLLDDLTPNDTTARFWPQTERLKAALLAAQLTDESHFWSMAHASASSFLRYLATPIAGLWYDVVLPNGKALDSPAPASTLYHIVDSLSELDRAVRCGSPEVLASGAYCQAPQWRP